MISTPLASRFKIIRIQPPTERDWIKWMNSKYGENWDKRVAAFLLAFRDEGYLFNPPHERETLEPYPVPRTWTWLALELHEGFTSSDDIRGFIGQEVGAKFEAFLKTNVDIEDLIRNPYRFHELEFDAKYMATFMLASWISKHRKTMSKCFPLIDEMCREKHEYLVLTAMSIKWRHLVQFFHELFAYQPEYKKVLHDIAVGIRKEISA